MINNIEDQDVIINDKELYNKKIKSVPKPEQNIGIDTSKKIIDNIVCAGTSSQIDISKIESFSQVSQRRDQVYTLLDTMCEDSIIAAILETYAEDATEMDEGKIVWVESNDEKVNKYVSYLLDTMRVDKNIYPWVYSLCKYGDLYLQLFKESEYNKEDEFFNKNKPLKENVKVKAYLDNDKYVHYLESIANPANMFELTRFGKTVGYIKTDVKASQKINELNTTNLQYKFKKGDVTIYDATKFVHAALEDNSSRVSEEVKLFIDDNHLENDDGIVYTVKRGQSLLYNVFKIWRELSLLENSMLLNRVTKSAIVRLINVEVGDMDKEQVGPHLQGIKSMLEQKSAINANNSMNEYTNPGPIENNIYVPVHEGKGTITADQIGGDVNIGQLPDIEYFQNKFFGCLRGNMKIRFSDNTIDTIEHACLNPELTIGKKINTCDSKGNIFETTITAASQTKIASTFIKFTLDDHSIIEVTPEHLMMLEDGTFKEAQYITENDTLMSR